MRFFSYFFACPHAFGGAGKKVSKPACVTNTSAGRKGPPGECFIPLSENIENLCKVVLTQHSWSGNPASGGAFADFQMFSDSRHRRPARQELPARQIPASLSRKKPNCFAETKCGGKKICGVLSLPKHGVREWRVRSLPGGRQGSIYIFLNFLVLFVSRQKVQLKNKLLTHIAALNVNFGFSHVENP